MTFRPRLAGAFLFLFLLSALPTAWLLRQDGRARLEITRNELAGMQPLASLRASMRSAVEDLLSGGPLPPSQMPRLLEFCRAWVSGAKELGYAHKLILDPRQDLYDLSYLSTVKLPERFQVLTELAALENLGSAGSPRGLFLKKLLEEMLPEETRAVELAAQGDGEAELSGVSEGGGLAGRDKQRRAMFRGYAGGKRLQLLEAARLDAELWEEACARLEARLKGLEAEQAAALRYRQALAFALPALLLLLGWLLMRRFAELRSSEAKQGVWKNYELLYHSIPLPVFLYSLETRRFIDANPAACALLKSPAEAIVGLSLAHFIPAADRAAFIEDLKSRDPKADAMDQRKIQDAEGKLIDVELSARYIEIGGKPMRLVMLKDVSAALGSQRALLRLERLAAIGQTAAGLAHEVRNPLAVISTCAQFLKLQLADRPVLHQDLDSILRQIDRLRDLVNEVLERSRGEDLELSEAPPSEILAAALQATRSRYGAAADRVRADLSVEGRGKLRADLAKLERVLVNLLLNAFQAMPQGGALSLAAREGEDAWVIEVGDNGPGIPEEKLAKVFEPFYTSKDTGSGLGLWICKSIIEQHGGSLEASNRRPRGAVFSIRLPKKGPGA
jgi:PAS domain S-box-containing protein